MASVPSSLRARLTGGSLALLAAAACFASTASTASAVPIAGSVSFSDYDHRPLVPSGLTTTVSVPLDAGDPSAAQLRRLQITLPQGFDLGPQMSTGGGGLNTCSAAAFSLNGAPAAGCAADTRIGAVSVSAPTVSETPLTGSVFLGAQGAVGALPPLFVEASVGGSSEAGVPRLKLAGALAVDADGRTSVTFDEIPAPFSELKLALSSGDASVLGTPAVCSTFAGVATFTSAGGETTAAAAPVSIDQDCWLPPFQPAFGMAADSPQAGATTPTALGIGRQDRSPRLSAVRLALPNGLLANIGSVPECPYTDLAAAACGAESRIGWVEAVAGVGPRPRTLRGDVFVTPRPPGAVAGVSIVVRARVGDVDLGNFVMPARVDLRPANAGLDVSFTVPMRFQGVALNLRSAMVRVDRPSFMINPSSCGPLVYASLMTNEYGQSTYASGATNYSGCENLPFVPTLSATLTGETEPLGHPNVRVALIARAGDSTLRSATVTLPRGVAADTANLQDICPRAAFDAVACSASQRVGTATARVGVTPEPIPGDVYLVQNPGQALPGLGLSFTGRYAQRVMSTVRVDGGGRLVTHFEMIPDLPLRSLDMDIFGGKKGPIQLSSTRCKDGAVWDASFVGQGGQVSSHTIAAPCPPGTAKRSAITLSSFTGLTWRISDLGGRTLQTAKLTLPKGFQFVRKRARLRQYQVVKLAGASAKLSVTNRTVVVRPRTKTTRSLSLKLKSGSVTRSSKSRSRKRVSVKVRLGFTDGTVQRQTIKLRAR